MPTRQIQQVAPTPAVNNADMRANLRVAVDKAREASKPAMQKFSPPALMPGVVPAGKTAAIAMDSASGVYDFCNQTLTGDFQPFPGYPALANLSTRGEYRQMASTMSTEMTREWISFKGATGADGEAAQDKNRIKELEAAVKDHDLQNKFALLVAQDCFNGRSQLSVNIKGADESLPLILSPKTVKKGSLEGFTPIEAMWTTPCMYDALDPTAPDFYKPRSWFVLGKEVHASRLLTMISRPLPDMLKPAYNFGGISLSQIAQPYVNNWLRTRQAVADLINNFSITALATNMGTTLQGNCDGTDLFARADLFTLTRSNRGLMLLDKDQEELVQVNTPLSGLHELQAQSQEHLCSISRIPAMILTGISPSGLNASSEGEVRAFYDWISAQQESVWKKPLETCIKLIMLDLWGEIDDTISFEFNPLWQTSAKEKAEINKMNIDGAVALIDRGVISPEEERERLASDETSMYTGIDPADVPELPEEEIGGNIDVGFEDPVATDKSVSEAQHRAMEAAAHGKSTLGIPKEVGQEFVSKD